MLQIVSSKTIGPDRNEAVRRFVREQIRDVFDGNQKAAAKAYGVTPSALSELLSDKRGAGMKLLDGIAKSTGKSVDEIVGGPAHAPQPVRTVYAERYPMFRNSPGWSEALAEARKARPFYPDYAWNAAGETSALVLERVTPDQVIRFAQAWLDTLTADRLEALDAMVAQRERAEYEARVLEAERIRAEQLAAGGKADELDAIFARLRDEQWRPVAPMQSPANDAAHEPPRRPEGKP